MNPKNTENTKHTIIPNVNSGFTRGKGYLEPFLARQRARTANRLIPAELRSGRILDIGCGTFPYFLSRTEFEKKVAIDQLPIPNHIATTLKIEGYSLNLNQQPSLPFDEHYFNIVTLLAVVEHLNPDSMAILFREIFRVLQPGGKVIMTTPAAWSDGLLHLMAACVWSAPKKSMSMPMPIPYH